MFSSVTNLAGRRPRFSSANWIPVANEAIDAMLDRGQSPYFFVVRRIHPPGVQRQVDLALQAVGHVLALR